MSNCINCGLKITEEQNKNFRRLCPDCIRIFEIDNFKIGRLMLWIGVGMFIIIGIPMVLMFSINYYYYESTLLYINGLILFLTLGFILFLIFSGWIKYSRLRIIRKQALNKRSVLQLIRESGELFRDKEKIKQLSKKLR